MTPPNLALFDPVLRGNAAAAIESGDAETLLRLLDNTIHLHFVYKHFEWLREVGQYEKTLLSAFIATRGNNCHWPLSTLKLLFSLANRDALLAAGDPLPSEGPFTVFRGVAGIGRQRKVRGISWTADREQATWFARRAALWGFANPAVFEAHVSAANVYAYSNERSEQEFLCDVDRSCRVRRVEVIP